MTDLSRWRLRVDHGAQTWHYLSPEEACDWPPSASDMYWLGNYHGRKLKAPKDAYASAINGFEFFKELQTEDGHWAGEYGGPMFLIPGLAIVMYITGAVYPRGYEQEMIRYLKNRANKFDGGWGIHIEAVSSVFGTALNYVALRLLGAPADDPVCVKARNHLHCLGGASGIPAWGKFWLAVLNVYDWDGVNPIPPELWCLPYSLNPIHPGRMWVHTRAVYLSMSYMYGLRFQADETDLIKSLRSELYVSPYEKIHWKSLKNHVAEVDLYAPHTATLDILNSMAGLYEQLPNSILRKKALEVVLDHIRAEDRNTNFLDLGPVNKVMNILVSWLADGPSSESFQKHLERVPDFMWMSSQGMMMNGTNGSQLWDTAFAVQALTESGIAEEELARPYMLKALEFLDDCQIKDNMVDYEKYYRHISKGAWPFSTREQSYTVSDCTAEGLKAVILLQNNLSYLPKLVSQERLQDAVDILLTMQNPDGGFASYETIRGAKELEWLNPAEVFGNIMIEYSYPECTTAVLLGLTSFRKNYGAYRRNEIDATIEKAADYVRNSQREDGSWYGSWGICFSYAMLFAMESLSSVGELYSNSPRIRKSCDFLLEKQMDDGGWGESYQSCETGEWVDHEQSQVVQTAWAVLSLMAVQYPNQESIQRGIELIMSRQQDNGEWLQEGIEGVFNKNCMISYPNYKFVFCIWALGRYSNIYEKKKF